MLKTFKSIGAVLGELITSKQMSDDVAQSLKVAAEADELAVREALVDEKLADLKTQIGDLETAKTAAEQKVTQLETEVQRLTAAETELKGFGETGEARTAFKQAADQNQIWVENMRKAGITLNADATTMVAAEPKSYDTAPWNKGTQGAK